MAAAPRDLECRVAVVGGGGIGSAATYRLARRLGDGVVCLEQHELGHDRGASEDHSRIIRLGYHSPVYTALTPASYDAWREVEAESGVPLVHTTGCVNIARPGTPGGAILDAYAAAMGAHGLGHERLDAAEVMRRWPQFRVPSDHEALFQPEGGILDIRKGGAVHRALARAHGAAVLPHAEVTAIRPRDDGVELETRAGHVRAERVVLCAGSWTRALVAQLGLDWPIRLTHEQVTYFATTQLHRFAPDRFPIWIWHAEDDFYGFPVFGEVATKAAVEEPSGNDVGLEGWDRSPDDRRIGKVVRFLDEVLPGCSGPVLRSRACLYDLPPDRDFIVDLIPGEPRIAVCVGAGHAAKFAALLGSILTDLVLDGRTAHPIEAFRADRPALTDPGFTAGYRLGGAAAAA